MQCKDIPDVPILAFLAKNPQQWHNWVFNNEYDVHNAMPNDTPDKAVHAKMRKLMSRDLVDGCDCGCRGDFVITEKGLNYLAASQKNNIEAGLHPATRKGKN